jgi:hypothetical protein
MLAIAKKPKGAIEPLCVLVGYCAVLLGCCWRYRRRKDSRIEIARFVEFVTLPPHGIADFLQLGSQARV